MVGCNKIATLLPHKKIEGPGFSRAFFYYQAADLVKIRLSGSYQTKLMNHAYA